MFVGMHRMLFINDNWLLNPATDILIRMMPQNLFETALADVLGQFARGAGSVDSAAGGGVCRRFPAW